jgi:hypothetical protein
MPARSFVLGHMNEGLSELQGRLKDGVPEAKIKNIFLPVLGFHLPTLLKHSPDPGGSVNKVTNFISNGHRYYPKK